MSHAQLAVEEGIYVRLTDEFLTEASLGVVRPFLDESAGQVLSIDLGGVRLPTAEGLGALVALNKEQRDRGGSLVLTNVPTATYEVFVLTRLVDVLDVRAE